MADKKGHDARIIDEESIEKHLIDPNDEDEKRHEEWLKKTQKETFLNDLINAKNKAILERMSGEVNNETAEELKQAIENARVVKTDINKTTAVKSIDEYKMNQQKLNYDHIWKNPKRIVQQQKQNSEYVEPIELKLNYKCKREDSPDGSNKCPDTKSETTETKLLNRIPTLTKENIDLHGLKKDYINVLIDTLDSESKDGVLFITKIQSLSAKANSLMSYNPRGILSIPHSAVRKQQSRKVGTLDDVVSELDSAIASLTKQKNESDKPMIRYKAAKLIAEYNRRKEDEIADSERYGFKVKGVPYLFDDQKDRFKATLLHEIGHMKTEHASKEIKNAIEQEFKRTDFKDMPSKNARKDAYEWFSEEYAMAKMGKPHNEIVNIFKNQKQNARGKCPKDSYEPGTFKCDPADSDVKEESTKPEKISKIEFETGGDGGSDGQYDGYIVARDPKTGKKMGYLDYSYLNGEYFIQMIETEKEYQRKGVATSLINELKKTFDKGDTLGMQGTFATKEGQAFMKSIGLGKDKFRKLGESDYNKLKEDAKNLDLDDNEREALQEYSLISSYMNSYLGGDPEYYKLTDEKLKDDIESKANDAVSGLRKSYLPFGIKTWRTVKSSIEDMMDEDSFKPGYVVFNPTILSTSFSRSKAFGYRKDPSGDKEKPLLMEVRLPKGSRAILQNGIDKAPDDLGFKHAGEYEVMVSPGNFVVSSYEELPKIRKLVWQAIP